ncbi:hypothetical protein [Enterococcus hirae]|uniref:FDXHR family putative zinc-binding protein n=1 Tax=Enterococcus hirae TaxID=1354 RepID=UPI0013ADA9AA|nr:hypothetical protein [Enterococcus hirae]NAE18207.1 hypothetical protein [Enterococcus hirae]
MSKSSTDVRCPRCDTRWRHREAVGHCANCHRTFVGGSAFDRHQLLDENGRVQCVDPATFAREADGWLYFDAVEPSEYMQNGSFWRLRQTDAQRIAHAQFVERVKRQSTQRSGEVI